MFEILPAIQFDAMKLVSYSYFLSYIGQVYRNRRLYNLFCYFLILKHVSFSLNQLQQHVMGTADSGQVLRRFLMKTVFILTMENK